MYCYTTGREIIAKKTLITHRLSGKAYEDLDSNIVIVIFYLLNDIIVVLLFTMVAEFEPRSVVCIQCILCMKFHHLASPPTSSFSPSHLALQHASAASSVHLACIPASSAPHPTT